MKVITVLNEKGGVGKTTLATHIASGLAIRGQRVVLIDADPQATATAAFGLEKRPALHDLLINEAQWQHTLQPGPQDNYTSITPKGVLFVLAGNEATRNIAGQLRRISEPRKRFLQLQNFADYIIVDTSPTPSMLHTSLMLATDFILLPTNAEMYSTDGLAESLKHIGDARETGAEFNLNVAKIAGIIPTMFRPKTGLHQGIVQQIRQQYGDLVWRGLPLRIVYGEAAYFRQMLFAYAPEDVATREMWQIIDRVERIEETTHGEEEK